MVELIGKTFDLLERVARDAPCSLRDLSNDCGLPRSTAYRIAATLVARGYLLVERRGRYHPGPAWHRMGHDRLTPLLASVSRRPLARLAAASRAHAHLGVLEGGMVTYLVKQRYGSCDVHSAENMQLEAYCSAIGKCLLAQQDPAERDAYLGSGPFVPLTPATITDPEDIRPHLSTICAQGWAIEIEESAPGLMCLSVPVLVPQIGISAAISISIVHPEPERSGLLDRLPLLQATRDEIEGSLSAKAVGLRQDMQ